MKFVVIKGDDSTVEITRIEVASIKILDDGMNSPNAIKNKDANKTIARAKLRFLSIGIMFLFLATTHVINKMNGVK